MGSRAGTKDPLNNRVIIAIAVLGQCYYSLWRSSASPESLSLLGVGFDCMTHDQADAIDSFPG